MTSSTTPPEVVVEEPTREDAVRRASELLELDPDDLKITVIQSGSSGFLGFFQHPWKIKARPRGERPSLRDAAVEEALKATESVDGSFTLDVKDRKIYLTVYPPQGSGQSVDPDKVIAHLNQVGLSYCDFDKVRGITNREAGKPGRIGQLPPGEDIDTAYEVLVSDDGLTAELVMHPPRLGGDAPDVDEVRRVLREVGISEGIDWDKVEEVVENRTFNQPVEIAHGREPEKGDDGRIEYYFDVESKPNFEEQEGRVDFREMGLINNVTEDELLAKKIEPTPGRRGLTVKGDPIDAPDGDDVELSFGANVRREGNELYSEISGQVVLQEGTVEVNDVYTVEGDVDYSTGNIIFDGTVVVEGHVRDRFKIKATGDIIVEKGVEKAYLQSEQNILVQAGIRGKSRAQVNAGGSIMAEFVEQAGLIAQDNVVVSEMIMHSRVDAGEGVYVTGSRGLIAGGEIRCGVELYAKEIGSIGTSETRIEVGIDPKFFREVAKIDKKITEQREKLDKVERALKAMDSRGDLEEPERKRLDKLHQTQDNLERNIQNFREEQNNLARRAEERDGARIMVEGKLFSGTRLAIGNAVLRIRSGGKEHCGFKKLRNSIEQTTFEKPAVPNIQT